MSNNLHPPRRTWDPQIVLPFVSEDRMSPYLDYSNGDLERAFQLYQYNIRLASAVQQTCAMVEVVVRNSMDAAMVRRAQREHPGLDWFDLPELDQQTKRDLYDARLRAAKSSRQRQPPRGKVIAELPFGFWKFLTSTRHYASLWVPDVSKAFPFGQSDLRRRQTDVFHILDRLTMFRNRVAHLEPVLRYDLRHLQTDAEELGSWIHPHVRAWIAQTSILPQFFRR